MTTFNKNDRVHKIQRCIILTERCIYFLLAILLLVIPLIIKINNKVKNNIHMALLIYILIYHFFICNFVNKFDSLHIVKILFSKDLNTDDNSTDSSEILSRKGDVIVINVYIFYVFFLMLGCYYKFLTWNMLLSGMTFLLGLNNIFKYKFCLIKKFAYSHKINCCSDCHIVGWENFLIFSIVPFIIYVNKFNTINIAISIFICILSLIELIVWEFFLYFKPERFSPLSNNKIGCCNCYKNCTGTINRKYSTKITGTYRKKSAIKISDKIDEHYVAFGLLAAALLTICEFFLLGEQYFMMYYLFMIIIFFELTSFRVIYKWVEKKYKDVFKHIEEIVVWKDDKEDNSHYKRFADKIFGITTINNILIYLFSISLLIGVVLILNSTNKLSLPTYIEGIKIEYLSISTKVRISCALIMLSVPIMIACRSFVIFYNSFRQLAYISTLDVKADYFTTGYKQYLAIKRFCSMAVAIMTFVCLTALLAILNSPIDLTGSIKKVIFTLLILISICPTVILIGTNYYLHIIRLKMKDKVIQKYNTIINNYEFVFSNTECNTQTFNIGKVIAERDMLLNLKIGEKKVLVSLSSLVTVAVGVTQVLLIVAELYKDSSIGLITKIFN